MFASTKEAFLKVSPSDTHFKLAVEELMKIYYRESDWPSFFAYAQYYRKRWPIRERHQTQLLEILALLRHCQDDLVAQLTTEYRDRLPNERERLDQILALSKTRFKGKAASNRNESAFKSHWNGTSLWPLSKEKISQVDPRKIKINVENRCPF